MTQPPKTVYRIETLAENHNRKGFDSGNFAADDHLKKMALQNLRQRHSHTYVLVAADCPDEIVGFYTITTVTVSYLKVPELVHGQAGKRIPAGLLAHIAVARAKQKSRHLARLLVHSLTTFGRMDRIAGLCGVIVDAADDSSRKLFLSYGFSRIDDRTPARLYMSIETVLKLRQIQ